MSATDSSISALKLTDRIQSLDIMRGIVVPGVLNGEILYNHED